MAGFAYEQLRYGLFVHYILPGMIYADGTPTKTIDEAADGFDVPGFVRDLEDMGVEYLILTAWHYLVRPLYPSAAMERWRPGNCPHRDLLGEVLDGLRTKGIKAIMYTHPRDGHDFVGDDRVRVGWGAGHHPGGFDTPNPQTFQYETWNAFMMEVYTEFFATYGSRIDGIFTDGAGPCRMVGGYPGYAADFPIVDYLMIRRLAKQTNPDMAIIQNYFGYLFCDDFAMPEGYFGYENEHRPELWPACVKALAMTPFSGWVAAQPKGTNVCRFTAEELFHFTVLQATCSPAGGVCWASGPYCGGGWEDGVLETLGQIGRWWRRGGAALRGIVPSASWPTVSGDTLQSKCYVVCCSSADRRYEYVHVLRMPEDGVVRLPAPADGAAFTGASVADGGCTIRSSGDGLALHLDPCPSPAASHTVVRLTRANNPDAPRVTWWNDDDKRFMYQGAWSYDYSVGNNTRDGVSCYEYDVHRTAEDGAFLFTHFEAADCLEICCVADPDGGTADVLIDHMKVGVVDTRAEVRSPRRLVFRYEGLYGGVHTLELVKTGGGSLEFDALRLTAAGR